MLASFYLPTRVVFGNGCIAENAALFAPYRRAFIVTGKHSARASGALDDVTGVLDSLGIAYEIFDRISENPPLLTCHEGGRIGAAFGADVVIGIGGGSPLDAAKAIAAFIANPEIEPMDVYSDERRRNATLPILAVPTTAGTGSEVNTYSVLSLPSGDRKRTFKASDAWPRVAFVDPRYAQTLPHATTVSTALDAFAHAMESYLSPRASIFSREAALFAAREIYDVLSAAPAVFTPEMRERLAAAATAGGMAISVTGTGFPHPLGYSITMLDGVPHGRACAAFAGEYIAYNERSDEGREKLAAFAAALGTTTRVLAALLVGLADVTLCFDEAEIEHRVSLVESAGNYTNSPYVISREDMIDIYRRLFGKKRK